MMREAGEAGPVPRPLSVSKTRPGSETLSCLRCGEAFQAQRSTAAFCSDYCRLWRCTADGCGRANLDEKASLGA